MSDWFFWKIFWCLKTCKKNFWKIRIFNQDSKRFCNHTSQKNFFWNQILFISKRYKSCRPTSGTLLSCFYSNSQAVFAALQSKNDVSNSCLYLRRSLRSFFGRKSALFLKDSPHSCDHFPVRIIIIKKSNFSKKSQFGLFGTIVYNIHMFRLRSYFFRFFTLWTRLGREDLS